MTDKTLGKENNHFKGSMKRIRKCLPALTKLAKKYKSKVDDWDEEDDEQWSCIVLRSFQPEQGEMDCVSRLREMATAPEECKPMHLWW